MAVLFHLSVFLVVHELWVILFKRSIKVRMLNCKCRARLLYVWRIVVLFDLLHIMLLLDVLYSSLGLLVSSIQITFSSVNAIIRLLKVFESNSLA